MSSIRAAALDIAGELMLSLIVTAILAAALFSALLLRGVPA